MLGEKVRSRIMLPPAGTVAGALIGLAFETLPGDSKCEKL